MSKSKRKNDNGKRSNGKLLGKRAATALPLALGVVGIAVAPVAAILGGAVVANALSDKPATATRRTHAKRRRRRA